MPNATLLDRLKIIFVKYLRKLRKKIFVIFHLMEYQQILSKTNTRKFNEIL